MNSLKKNFLQYCSVNKLKVNKNQIEIIDLLIKFKNNCFNKNFFSGLFRKEKKKIRILFIWRCWCGKNHAIQFFL